MRGFKTEGLILKRRNFGEADRILTVFTKHRGKISVLAKGVRRITSRRAGNVELLNRVSIYLYPGKNFLILTEATSLDTYQRLKEDLTLSTIAFHIIELINKLTAENQENPLLYSNLLEVLTRLSARPRQLLIRAFEVKILKLMGFWSIRNLKEVSVKTKILLSQLENLSWNEIEKMSIGEKQAIELEQVLRYYLESVIEGQLKSRQFLKKL